MNQNNNSEYKIIYGLDKVDFVSQKSVKEIKDSLRMMTPNPTSFCKYYVKEISDKEQGFHHLRDLDLFNSGYKTIVTLTKININGFLYFIKNKIDLGRPFVVEIFKDILFDSENEAIEKAQFLQNHLYLLYQRKNHHYYNRNIYSTQSRRVINFKTEDKQDAHDYRLYRRRKDRTTIGDSTLYLGEGDFDHVTYARESKIAHLPAVHQEFRLKGRNILRLAEIQKKKSFYMESLHSLQSSRVSSVYMELEKKHIKIAKVNELRLAKYLRGLSKKKMLSMKEKQTCQLQIRHLKNAYGLKRTSDFMKYFRDNNINYSLFLQPC